MGEQIRGQQEQSHGDVKQPSFLAGPYLGFKVEGVEVLVREDPENMLRGQIIRSIYAKRKFRLDLVIKGEIPKN